MLMDLEWTTSLCPGYKVQLQRRTASGQISTLAPSQLGACPAQLLCSKSARSAEWRRLGFLASTCQDWAWRSANTLAHSRLFQRRTLGTCTLAWWTYSLYGGSEWYEEYFYLAASSAASLLSSPMFLTDFWRSLVCVHDLHTRSILFMPRGGSYVKKAALPPFVTPLPI